MVLWWTKIIAAGACVGVILLSLVMEAYINDARNVWAIFWFFVAVAATVGFYLVSQMEQTQSASVGSSKYWEVYHGTPTWNNASGAMREGFIPGKDGTYGIAVYTTFDFALAANYARNGGYVFRLFIDQNTPIANYSQIPGETVEAKREHCLRNGWGLVYEEQFKMFLCFGYIGVPVAIPGLKQVEVLDLQGKPVHI